MQYTTPAPQIPKCDSGGSINAITISARASHGDSPTTLYTAGSQSIACVIPLEQLGNIELQYAIFSAKIPEKETQMSYGELSLIDPIVTRSISAQSGQAYFVAGLSAQGRVSDAPFTG